MVKQVANDAEFKQLLAEAGSKLVVVDFFAEWCGPCKRIAPFIESLSHEMSNVVFLKVDVDQLAATARDEQISAMPTFRLYKEGVKVDELVGASQDKLRDLVTRNA